MKLSVTLRYLATDETSESLMYQSRVYSPAIAQFIPSVCQAIYSELKNIYLKLSSTKTEWGAISSKTAERWQYANCIGACDEKHIGLVYPKDSGSNFFNHKSLFSIVSLALVDYDYKFIYVDFGCQGRISDGGIYRNSSLCKALTNGTLNLPRPRPLSTLHENHPSTDSEPKKFHLYFLADDAFPFIVDIMKPYALRNLDD